MAIEASEASSSDTETDVQTSTSINQTEVNSYSESLPSSDLSNFFSLIMSKLEKHSKAIKGLERRVIELNEDQEGYEKDLNEVRIRVHKDRIEENTLLEKIQLLEVNQFGLERRLDTLLSPNDSLHKSKRKLRQPQAQKVAVTNRKRESRSNSQSKGTIGDEKGKAKVSEDESKVPSKVWIKKGEVPESSERFGSTTSDVRPSGTKPHPKSSQNPKGCRFYGKTNHITSMCRFKNGYYDSYDWSVFGNNPVGPKSYWVPKPT